MLICILVLFLFHALVALYLCLMYFCIKNVAQTV